MRLVSWNIDGLAPWLDDPTGLPTLVEALGGADVLCLQEVRLRADDAPAIARMRAALPGYRCHASLCRDPRNVRFRGGRAYGVATYLRAELAAAGDDGAVPPWDREGRVAISRLPSLGLAVVDLYAVNGTDKPYVDPDSGAPAGDRHAFKRRVQDLAFAEVDALVAAGLAPIVAGDLNVSPAAIDVTPRLRTEEPHAGARAALAEHLARRGMVDAWRIRNPERRAYTWRLRGRGGRLDAARVDHILLPAALVPRVQEAAILGPPPGRRGSDHAPIALDLDA